MKISVITPSFNQGQYLEKTILSVISQSFDDFEYIIMDGGSTDNSVDIIRKHEEHITYWQSIPDDGQVHAINEGFGRASGEIFYWLNSDDVLLPGVLTKIHSIFSTNPQLELLYGDYSLRFSNDKLVTKPKVSFDYTICLQAYLMIPQCASFWTRRIYEQVGGLNTDYHYSFDYYFFLNIGKATINTPNAIRHENDIWAEFRVHDQSKSVSQCDSFSTEDKLIRASHGFNDGTLSGYVKSHISLLKLLFRFYRERGFIPLRKEGGKA